MLVTVWIDDDNRVTRDADFLGHGDSDPNRLIVDFRQILAGEGDDGLVFDLDALSAEVIREEMEYSGVRLKTAAYLERTRIPVTIHIGFGDAMVDAPSISIIRLRLTYLRPKYGHILPLASSPRNFRRWWRWASLTGVLRTNMTCGPCDRYSMESGWPIMRSFDWKGIAGSENASSQRHYLNCAVDRAVGAPSFR